MASRGYFGKMNSTLGSGVSLAMFIKKSAHICNSGGLLAAPNTAEVLELLSSTLNSEAVDDFWVGIDDM